MEAHFSPTVCALPSPIFGGKVQSPFTKKKRFLEQEPKWLTASFRKVVQLKMWRGSCSNLRISLSYRSGEIFASAQKVSALSQLRTLSCMSGM
jgi:hypothetical protein